MSFNPAASFQIPKNPNNRKAECRATFPESNSNSFMKKMTRNFTADQSTRKLVFRQFPHSICTCKLLISVKENFTEDRRKTRTLY